MATVTIGGVPHYAVQLIVLGGVTRPEGRPVDVFDNGLTPVVVRDPVTQLPFVPQTLTGEAAGLSQVFLTPVPEGLASCDGGPVSPWSTRQYAEMLEAAQQAAEDVADAKEAAEDAKAASVGLAATVTGALVRVSNNSGFAIHVVNGPGTDPLEEQVAAYDWVAVLQ